MSPEPLTCAIIGHLVGDYLLQNDWMANGKKQSSFRDWFCDKRVCEICDFARVLFGWYSFPCLVHCFLWTCAVCMFAGWGPLPWLILFLTHYIQDRSQIIGWWMRLNRQQKFAEPPLGPWSIIVVDNVWHIVTLWAVWKWIV